MGMAVKIILYAISLIDPNGASPFDYVKPFLIFLCIV